MYTRIPEHVPDISVTEISAIDVSCHEWFPSICLFSSCFYPHVGCFPISVIPILVLAERIPLHFVNGLVSVHPNRIKPSKGGISQPASIRVSNIVLLLRSSSSGRKLSSSNSRQVTRSIWGDGRGCRVLWGRGGASWASDGGSNWVLLDGEMGQADVMAVKEWWVGGITVGRWMVRLIGMGEGRRGWALWMRRVEIDIMREDELLMLWGKGRRTPIPTKDIILISKMRTLSISKGRFAIINNINDAVNIYWSLYAWCLFILLVAKTSYFVHVIASLNSIIFLSCITI